MKKYRYIPIWLLLGSVILLTACAGKNPVNPGPTVSSVPTNTLAPTATPSPTPTVLPEKLVISEIMATNKSYPMNGSLCDWIELYNAGESDIDLSGFYLSDKENKPMKSRLPQVILKPSEYIVLTCENDITLPGAEEKTPIKGDLSFKLSGDGETVLLTRADGVLIDTVSYEDLSGDMSFTKDGPCELPSPGFENTAMGHTLALEQVAAAAYNGLPGLVINEILASNNHFNSYKNAQGVSDYYDILELYNASSAPISLSDYYLSDSSKHLFDYRLPDVTLNGGEYLLIYCMGRDARHYDAPTELFKEPESPIALSYFGETLYLSHKDGLIVDCVTYPEMYDKVSYGRHPESPSRFVLQASPTLGKVNTPGEKDFSETPAASLESGVYTAPINVTFTGSGAIYYTTDNSIPGKKSKLWDGNPITIDRSTTIRAVSYDGDKLKSFEAVYNYFFTDMTLTMDVVSVSISEPDWATLQATDDEALRFAINVALYKNLSENGKLVLSEEFSQAASLELVGGSSPTSAKPSYHIKFRSQYGPSALKYKLYDDSEQCEFKSFSLRSGSQANARDMIRDEFLSGLLYSYYPEELLLHEGYHPVNLFINGEYRGVYYIREHLDRDMIAEHYGLEPEDICTSRNISTTNYNFKGGTKADKNEISRARELIKNGNFSDAKVFEEFFEIFDYENMLVFWATELWSADFDCHLRAYKAGDDKWRLALHDHDLISINSHNYTFKNKFFAEEITTQYQLMLKALLNSKTFRSDLLAKIGELTATAYSNEYASAYAEKLIDTIRNDMKYNCELWGGQILYPKLPNSTSKFTSYSGWEKSTTTLISRLNQQREETIDVLKKYIHMTDDEEKLYFGQE